MEFTNDDSLKLHNTSARFYIIIEQENSNNVTSQAKKIAFIIDTHDDIIYTYRIAGYFRGMTFSRFSRLTLEPRKFSASNSCLL